jgi:histidinol-phosphate aminotransferase
MEPNKFTQKLTAYPLSSHQAWEESQNPDLLKLDWNEADVELPESLKHSLVEFIKNGRLNWYPDVANQTLLKHIAEYCDVPTTHIQYFTGEDSVLDFVVRTFISPDDEVGVVAPTYDNFRVFVESVGGKITPLHPDDIFKSDISTLLNRISRHIKLMYLVNPNNPTGTLYNIEEIDRLLCTFPDTLFLIDEAYFEFTGVTVVSLVKKHLNLIVGRSFSKAFGLASFRIGYAVTSPLNLEHINKLRNGKNIAALAQIAAISALRDPQYMTEYVAEVTKSRDRMSKALSEIGFLVQETPANFILIKTADAKSLQSELKKHGVYVRLMDHLQGLESYVRITVGPRKSTDQFLKVMSNLVSNGDIRPT